MDKFVDKAALIFESLERAQQALVATTNHIARAETVGGSEAAPTPEAAP